MSHNPPKGFPPAPTNQRTAKTSAVCKVFPLPVVQPPAQLRFAPVASQDPTPSSRPASTARLPLPAFTFQPRCQSTSTAATCRTPSRRRDGSLRPGNAWVVYALLLPCSLASRLDPVPGADDIDGQTNSAHAGANPSECSRAPAPSAVGTAVSFASAACGPCQPQKTPLRAQRTPRTAAMATVPTMTMPALAGTMATAPAATVPAATVPAATVPTAAPAGMRTANARGIGSCDQLGRNRSPTAYESSEACSPRPSVLGSWDQSLRPARERKHGNLIGL